MEILLLFKTPQEWIYRIYLKIKFSKNISKQWKKIALNEEIDVKKYKYPRGDKNPTNPNNHRPISLLSTIYKLASYAISNRIKNILKYIIWKLQKAYISSDNLLSTMLYCNKSKKDNLLLLHFRKAFDSIDHDNVYEVMESLHFGKYENIFNSGEKTSDS